MKNAYLISKIWVIIVKWLKESPYLFASCNSFTKKVLLKTSTNVAISHTYFHKFKSQLHRDICFCWYLQTTWRLVGQLNHLVNEVTKWEKETRSLNQFLEIDLSFTIHSLTSKIPYAVRYFRHQHKFFSRLWSTISITVVKQNLGNREKLLNGSWI